MTVPGTSIGFSMRPTSGKSIHGSETEFTLSLASKYDFIAGVVGWVDLDSNNAKDDIDKLCESKFLKGFRPMIHDIQDDAWMLNDRLKENIKYLNEKKLIRLNVKDTAIKKRDEFIKHIIT